MANIGFISLGCAKNQVDCERMMYRVQEAGHTVCPGIAGCDVVVINTCGFIDSAKSEAIDFIKKFFSDFTQDITHNRSSQGGILTIRTGMAVSIVLI